MSDKCQEIWNADQSHNGIGPIFLTQSGDDNQGYVKVNAELDESRAPELRVLTETVIPKAKLETYNLVRKLFNNYALQEGAIEVDTAQERAERHQFVEAIRNSPPMEVARAYVGARTETPISPEVSPSRSKLRMARSFTRYPIRRLRRYVRTRR